MSTIMCKIVGVNIDRRTSCMTFFGYVDRQKQMIRRRHAGEEVLITRGGSRLIREGDCALSCTDFCDENFDDSCDENKTVEQLLRELMELPGLNTAERARFARRDFAGQKLFK